MKKYLLWSFCFVALLAFLPACKKERCLKCTTTVSGVDQVQPEVCDTDQDVLDAEEEKLQNLVNDFVEMGWEASIDCSRQ